MIVAVKIPFTTFLPLIFLFVGIGGTWLCGLSLLLSNSHLSPQC
jgi:hypothetical protein